MDADTLRGRVVLLVLCSITGLAFALYGLIGYLVVSQGGDAVPDGLWVAAGGYGGALVTWLVNSKGNSTEPAPVKIEQPEGEPVPVTPEYDPDYTEA